MHRNHLTIAVTLTKVGSFYTLNKLGRVVTLESPLHCCHPYQGWIILCFLMNLGWGTLESPHHHCHPYQGWIILHFLINQMGGEVYQNYCPCQSVCLSVYSNWISLQPDIIQFMSESVVWNDLAVTFEVRVAVMGQFLKKIVHSTHRYHVGTRTHSNIPQK